MTKVALSSWKSGSGNNRPGTGTVLHYFLEIRSMNKQHKEIKPGLGLGNLTFGSSRDQVKKLLGAPSETEKYSLSDLGDDETEAWHYDELDLSLSFDEENEWKLSSIAVSAEDYTLNGETVIGKSKKEILDVLTKMDLGEPEEDEEVKAEDSGNSLMHVDGSSLSLWFEGDELSELQIGPFYDTDGIKWP
jgi:hypothetical protein